MQHLPTLMKYVLLTVMLATSIQSLRAQEYTINSADITEIQQQALRHVRQFEGLLNLLAQPDSYLKEHSYQDLVRDYYREGSEYQVFRDSLVTIENDLSPEEQPASSAVLPLAIKEYVQAFFTQYEKSPVASVFFSNYEVSPVKQGELTYVEVFYTSEFAGRNRAYPSQSYPLRRRKASIEARPQTNGWQVVIIEISNFRPDTVFSEEGEANKFAELSRVYQPGKTYSLPIRINPDTPPSSLILYRDSQQVEDISDVLTDSSFTWQVPKQVERGDGYQLRLYDPLTQKTVESSSFIIRRKFP